MQLLFENFFYLILLKSHISYSENIDYWITQGSFVTLKVKSSLLHRGMQYCRAKNGFMLCFPQISYTKSMQGCKEMSSNANTHRAADGAFINDTMQISCVMFVRRVWEDERHTFTVYQRFDLQKEHQTVCVVLLRFTSQNSQTHTHTSERENARIYFTDIHHRAFLSVRLLIHDLSA